MKFRRWGPYVWWICPSRKCLFENKTDLSFVKGEYQTKCQYCNTPITIKLTAGQLELESAGGEEEEAKPSPAKSAPEAPAATIVSQPPSQPAPAAITPPSSGPKESAPAPSSASSPTTDKPATKQMAPAASKDSGTSKSSKESKKKAAS